MNQSDSVLVYLVSLGWADLMITMNRIYFCSEFREAPGS